MLHSADEKASVAHLEFWIDIFAEVSDDFSLLVRDEKSYKSLISKYPKLQICYAKNPIDVESVVNLQPDLKCIFFTTNMAKNIHLLRFNHVKHIFIGTKNSEWLSKFNKSYRAYDEIWCGGEFLVDRVKKEIGNTGHLEFKIVGKPQLKDIFSMNNQEKKTSLVLIDNQNELLLRQVYFAHNILNNKFYIYLSKESNNIKNDLLNIAKSHNFISNIKPFDSKDLLDEFATRVSYIITDLKNLNPYLLSYAVPVLVYIDKDFEKYTIEPKLLQEALYYFSDKDELLGIMKNLDENSDLLKEERENILNQFFNKDVVMDNKFLKYIKEEIK
jgi:hypothetical protein